MSIKIVVNDQSVQVELGSNIEQLLQQLAVARRGVAVEVNGEVVPVAQYDSIQLRPDDCLEVVALVGGG